MLLEMPLKARKSENVMSKTHKLSMNAKDRIVIWASVPLTLIFWLTVAYLLNLSDWAVLWITVFSLIDGALLFIGGLVRVFLGFPDIGQRIRKTGWILMLGSMAIIVVQDLWQGSAKNPPSAATSQSGTATNPVATTFQEKSSPSQSHILSEDDRQKIRAYGLTDPVNLGWQVSQLDKSTVRVSKSKEAPAHVMNMLYMDHGEFHTLAASCNPAGWKWRASSGNDWFSASTHKFFKVGANPLDAWEVYKPPEQAPFFDHTGLELIFSAKAWRSGDQAIILSTEKVADKSVVLWGVNPASYITHSTTCEVSVMFLPAQGGYFGQELIDNPLTRPWVALMPEKALENLSQPNPLALLRQFEVLQVDDRIVAEVSDSTQRSYLILIAPEELGETLIYVSWKVGE